MTIAGIGDPIYVRFSHPVSDVSVVWTYDDGTGSRTPCTGSIALHDDGSHPETDSERPYRWSTPFPDFVALLGDVANGYVFYVHPTYQDGITQTYNGIIPYQTSTYGTTGTTQYPPVPGPQGARMLVTVSNDTYDGTADVRVLIAYPSAASGHYTFALNGAQLGSGVYHEAANSVALTYDGNPSPGTEVNQYSDPTGTVNERFTLDDDPAGQTYQTQVFSGIVCASGQYDFFMRDSFDPTNYFTNFIRVHGVRGTNITGIAANVDGADATITWVPSKGSNVDNVVLTQTSGGSFTQHDSTSTDDYVSKTYYGLSVGNYSATVTPAAGMGAAQTVTFTIVPPVLTSATLQLIATPKGPDAQGEGPFFVTLTASGVPSA